MIEDQAARFKTHDWGWCWSLALHALGLWALLAAGHILTPVLKPEKPLIPIDIVFGPPEQQAGQGAVSAAPQPARRDTTPHPAAVRPDAVRPPADPLEAQLAALAQLRASDTGLTQSQGAGGSGQGGGYTIKDLVRAQILRHWGPDARSPISVGLHVVIAPGGKLLSVAIIDQQRFAQDAAFRDIAISMRNAVTLASPFDLPANIPASALNFTLDISPQDAR